MFKWYILVLPYNSNALQRSFAKKSKKNRNKSGEDVTDAELTQEESVGQEPDAAVLSGEDLYQPFTTGDVKKIDSTPDNLVRVLTLLLMQ